MPDFLDQFGASLNLESIISDFTVRHIHHGKSIVIEDGKVITIPVGLKKGMALQLIPLGDCTVVAGSGVTVNSPGSLSFSAPYVPIQLFCYDTNVWIAVQGGDTGGVDSVIYRLTGSATPTDGQTLYCGFHVHGDFGTTPIARVSFFRNSGTISVANLYFICTGGTAELVTFYIRVNNSVDHLLGTASFNTAEVIFFNDALNIPIAQNSIAELKMVCPTWVTDPGNCTLGGYIIFNQD